MTPRRKSAADRRAEIVATALALAGEMGPHKVTTEAVATRIGLTQPAIFRHFPRKDDMWLAVMAWLREQLSARWEDALTAPAHDALGAVVAAHLDFVSRLPALPLVLLSPELRRDCAALAEETEHLMAAFMAALSRAIRLDQTAGRLSGRTTPEDAAQLVLAVIQGTALRWAVAKQGFDLKGQGIRILALAISGLAP
ncbi:TetR family transcriptional regulator [Magnetospirillum aberrantis]|uniref:TetR/AcrR family transcriptional regulator n=1 Tax=Magnetospirillum aberrantis SpK TaxID=908842 RepID=A0A7C9UTS3_9PROT|nr:TetR/AcrR family transcriptional regulator [Magnetospirillum aberrantis SpK]